MVQASEDCVARSFLRWAGSKRQLVPDLARFWNDSFKRYVEPFMGSACLFFALRPNRAMLGDINRELVETFKIVRSNPRELAAQLDRLPQGENAFYDLRRQSPEALSSIDAAARFIFLNRYCFNGLFRTNREGQFNVPYGPTRSGHLPGERELIAAATLLRRASLKCSDFEAMLLNVQKDDFVYLDPPFAISNRRMFRQYGPSTFGLRDLDRLENALIRMDRRGAGFVVSYACCKEARLAFSRWPMRKVFVRRNIAGFTHCRRRAAELLISNLL
jgi:DNA adenine methylase